MRHVHSILAMWIWIGFASVAHAHGGGPHVMGTVQSIDAKSITVADTAGKQVVISVDEKVVIDRDGKPTTLGEIKPGERVVVHTRKTEAGLVAVAIKAGAGSKAHPHGETTSH